MAHCTNFCYIYVSTTLPSLVGDCKEDFLEEVTLDQILKAEEELGTRQGQERTFRGEGTA